MIRIKSFLFYFVLFSFLVKSFLTAEPPQIKPDQSYTTKYEGASSKIELEMDVEIPDSSKSSYYLHFSTSPINDQSQDLQQILFSTESSASSTKETEIYSFRYSRNANLITLADKNTTQIFVTIICFKYPCSFNFIAKLEENMANLNLEEMNNYYLYNTNSIGKEKMNIINFKIPKIEKSGKNRIYIAILNPSDINGDYITLYYIKSEGKQINNVNKINMGVLYWYDQDNTINGYKLEIESLENQFITIIIKSSSLNSNSIESEITPNTIAKFSNLNVNSNKVNECFKINENYITNFLNNNNNFLFATIDFISLPFKAYLKYADSEEEIDNTNKKNSLNVILTKKSEQYPQICFEQGNTKMKNNIFMLELSHMYPGMEYIDIYSPIFSGFFNNKMLLAGSLGIYSHYSDIHFIDKISFYLKPLKGKPIMYLVQCEDYPNCYNKYEDLENKENVIKAKDFGDYQFCTRKYKTKTKELSPSGPSQNLLYVYCPSNEEDYCHFQILIYSDSDEIVLNDNEEFNVVAEKDENLMFKLSYKKGYLLPEETKFCLNISKNDVEFDTMEEYNNSTITHEELDQMFCYTYNIDKKYYDLSNKDVEFVFNIKANRDINYKLTNKGKRTVATKNIGEIINEEDFSFPYKLNYLLNETDSDLVFNLYLNDKNKQGLDLKNVEIGAIILNETFLLEFQYNNEKAFLDGSIKEQLDPATRSCTFNIKKEYYKNIIKDDKENYYLHFLILNNDSNANDNKAIMANMFLLEKGGKKEHILNNNTFISDKFILEDNNIQFNLYFIKMKMKTKLEIKFSSNYPLNDEFLVYFLENTESNIDINYLEQNKKPYTNTSIGQIYTLLYENQESNKKDMIFAVVSKLEKDKIQLPSINYVFKYNIFSDDNEYNKTSKYDFNENYNLILENNKYIISFNSIQKDGKALPSEIYIREISENKLLPNETISTYSKIESEYKLIKGEKKEEGDITNITIPNLENINNSYSILIDIPEENEKFVISNKTIMIILPPSSDEGHQPSGDNGTPPTEPEPESNDDSLVLKIVIPIVVVVVVVVIILIILMIKKKRGTQFTKDLMKTSFKEEGYLLQEKH